MKAMKVMIVMTLLIIPVQCRSADDSIRWYRHIKIDGKREIVGRYPVATGQARKVNCYRFEYDSAGRLVDVRYFKNGQLHDGSYFGAPIVKIEYDQESERRRFYDKDEKPTQSEAVFTLMLRLDRENRKLYESNLDSAGALTKDSDGVAVYVWTLDENGWCIQAQFLNESGVWIANADSCFLVRREYDRQGNVTLESCHDLDGKFVLNASGTAYTSYLYDSLGNDVEVTFHGVDSGPRNNTKGVASMRVEYDHYGNRTRGSIYSAEGAPARSPDTEYSLFKVGYDYAGNMLDIRYFDSSEVLRYSIRRDRDGNDIEYATYGPAGLLEENPETGVAIVRLEYDDRGNVREERFYGADKQLKERLDTGVAIEKRSVRNKGLSKEIVYYDSKGQITEDKQSGIAMTREEHNSDNTVVTVSNFDRGGSLKEDNDGIAIIEYVFDTNDKIIEVRTMGVDRRLQNDKGGVAEIRWQRDSEGRVQRKVVLDADGNVLSEESGEIE